MTQSQSPAHTPHDAPPPRSRFRSRAILGVGLGVGIMVVAVTLLLGLARENPDAPATDEIESAQKLELAQAALAATENLDNELADRLWQNLFERVPEDPSVALNRALNRILGIDRRTLRVTNSALDSTERSAARSRLPADLESARVAIADFRRVASESGRDSADDSVLVLWMQSRLALREAVLLPASLTTRDRIKTMQTLVNAIDSPLAEAPTAVILAGPLTAVLDAIEDPLEGLPPTTRETAADAFKQLSDRHPNNLFIARHAARLNIQSRRRDSVDLVRRTLRLASSIEPSLARLTGPIGMSPAELVAAIQHAIESNDWSTAEVQMLRWFNVLNATELVKTDRRRAAPHPLDKISFTCLRRFARAVAGLRPLGAGNHPLTFAWERIPSPTPVVDVHPIDVDLDLRDDLVSVTADGMLQLHRNPAGDAESREAPRPSRAWLRTGSTMLPRGFDASTRLLAMDLFMVDSSDPQRVKATDNRSVMATADYSSAARHDTLPTLIAFGRGGVRLVALDGRSGTPPEEQLVVIESETGLESIGAVTCLTCGDLEGDGDLDLIVGTELAGIRFFINSGNRTFFELPAGGRLPASAPIGAMAIVDLDRDLDLDIVTVEADSGRVAWIENLLHLQFQRAALEEVPAVPGVASVTVAELDGNVSWDLVITGARGGQIVHTQTADAGAWTIDDVSTIAGGEVSSVADFDNDSYFEAIGRTATLRLVGAGAPAMIAKQRASLPSTATTTDFDADGKLDLVGILDGQVSVGRNTTETAFHHLDVRFRGIDDNNANSGRVNHYAIGGVLELRFGPHYRAQVITSPSTHFGTGAVDRADAVRIIMPNGLTQTIRNPTMDVVLEEEQTLKGSCPYLYGWDGGKFAFITDCLWSAPLGLQVARGVVAQGRPWEYLKIPGELVQPLDGRYELRLTEELWEVAYVDHVTLQAVDHPADVDVWTNEKVGPGHLAEPTLYAFGPADRRPVVTARDTTGRLVTELLSGADDQFVQGFDRRLRQGLCPPHWMDLTFAALDPKPAPSGSGAPGDGRRGGRGEEPACYLVLTGWILPTDTSLNIQIDQNPNLAAVEYPSLWVPDSKAPSGWRKAIEYVGFPGGKTKTIVIDVTAVVDRKSPQFRIRTSAQIYWDQAQLAVVDRPQPVLTRDCGLLSAELAYRGFSRKAKPGPRRPETYFYNDVSVEPKWPPLDGPLTCEGSVSRLLRRWDDTLVVMAGGDEIRMTFSVPEAPVPPGWKRDFILHCVGWDKDADLNTLDGQSTGPLPFRAMSQYPPSLLDSVNASAADALNRSHLKRSQGYRDFWYRPRGPFQTRAPQIVEPQRKTTRRTRLGPESPEVSNERE